MLLWVKPDRLLDSLRWVSASHRPTGMLEYMRTQSDFASCRTTDSSPSHPSQV